MTPIHSSEKAKCRVTTSREPPERRWSRQRVTSAAVGRRPRKSVVTAVTNAPVRCDDVSGLVGVPPVGATVVGVVLVVVVVGVVVEVGEEPQRLVDPQAVGEREVAGREAHVLHGRAAPVREAPAEQLDGALVRVDGTEQHQQERGLARSVRSEHAVDRPFRHGQVHPVDSGRALEVLDQADGFDRKRTTGIAGDRGKA